jgi:Fur family ferric uptake transcriptional regulator
MKMNIIFIIQQISMQKLSSNSRTISWLQRLKTCGYRLTAPRRAVIEILADSDRTLNATQIYDLAREIYPSLGLVSVYRTLDKLESLKIIQRVHQPDGCHAYIAAFTGHQHLLLCQDCGSTVFFQGDNLDELVFRVERDSGFQISDHWLQLFGICAPCQESNRDKT